MFKVRKTIAVILAFAAVFSLGTYAFYSGTEAPAASEYTVIQRPAIINYGSVYIREEPKSSGKILATVSLGKEIFVLGRIDDDEGITWYRFNFTPSGGNAQTGFVMAKYCDLVHDIGMVTSGALSVRQTPSVSGVRVGGLTAGDGVYIYETLNPNNEVWYRIEYNGSPAYVMSDYVGIMSMPSGNARARYKNIVTAKIRFENVPKGYKAVVDGQTYESNGEKEFFVSAPLGQLADSRLVIIRLYDTQGKLKGETASSMEVDTSIWGKITEFFGFVFNGFKWKSQTVEIV